MHTRFSFVSTYPPTQCGLATFTSSLRAALAPSDGSGGGVVRLVDVPSARPAPEVVAQLVRGDPGSLVRAAAHLDDADVAIVQHEYGIHGGRDGAEVLDLLDRLRVPSIVVLHTVLSEPTPHQREVLEGVVARADAVVAMTATARDRLVAGYRVDPGRISVIPHGAADVAAPAGAAPALTDGRPTVLTWGLLGPGKGIEWGIEAWPLLDDLRPAPRYLVAGQTHPKVLDHEGEAYRDGLLDRVRRLGLQDAVSLDGRYHEAPSLARLVRDADVVLLPYDSTEQVTSGVLIEAVAAGKPVVATEFPHARELLAGGAGLVVPHRDPVAIARALRAVLTRQELAASMSRAAVRAAPSLQWSAVAEQYRALARLVMCDRITA